MLLFLPTNFCTSKHNFNFLNRRANKLPPNIITPRCSNKTNKSLLIKLEHHHHRLGIHDPVKGATGTYTSGLRYSPSYTSGRLSGRPSSIAGAFRFLLSPTSGFSHLSMNGSAGLAGGLGGGSWVLRNSIRDRWSLRRWRWRSSSGPGLLADEVLQVVGVDFVGAAAFWWGVEGAEDFEFGFECCKSVA